MARLQREMCCDHQTFVELWVSSANRLTAHEFSMGNRASAYGVITWLICSARMSPCPSVGEELLVVVDTKLTSIHTEHHVG